MNSAVIPFSFPIYIALEDKTLSNYLLPIAPLLWGFYESFAYESLLYNFFLYCIWEVPFFEELSDPSFSSANYIKSFLTPEIFEFEDLMSSFFNPRFYYAKF